ncbi:Fic family protein [Azospirillum sp. TSO22-1]|uniref:Fic family protein n=1 Tax=Azospirillum sp. TSO22-1 TaxID=716789 RepID=UPI000D61DDC9|nr:Fic family protein [Azospirillum sp. TSO22-1]PWC52344.1 cell filamentation protein Fic [Azospirillum sp. TSO22-1]
MALLDDINAKKRALDAARPLPVEVVSELADRFERELTIACVTVEGIDLVPEEVLHVLGRGAVLRNRPPEPQRLVQNHAQALHLMARLAYEGGGVITERTVAAFHGVLFQGLDAGAGQYRDSPLPDEGETADPAKIRVSMSALSGWLRRTDPGVETALEAHHRLMIVRPFAQGNAAVALLILNLILNRAGYPPVAVHPDDLQGYADSVDRARTVGDKVPYRDVMLKLLGRALDDCLEAMARAAGVENAS